jgi:hypothetical protein
MKSALSCLLSDYFHPIFDVVMKVLGCPLDDAPVPLQMISEKTSARHDKEHQVGNHENCRESEDDLNGTQNYFQGLDRHCIIVRIEFL